jgi:hypothetical protein
MRSAILGCLFVVGCGSSTNTINTNDPSDFAYALECTSLCTDEGDYNQCADADDVVRACEGTCEQVLTGTTLACAACILDNSDGPAVYSDSGSSGIECVAEYTIGSPTDCVEECS